MVAKSVNIGEKKKGLLTYYRHSGAFNSKYYKHLDAKWWNQIYAL